MIEAIALGVALSLGYAVHDDPQLESAAVYEIQVTDRTFFAFTNYQSPSFRKAGQTFHELDITGYGLGIRLPVSNKLQLTLSGGQYRPQTNYDDNIMHEAVRNEFVRNGQIAPFNPTNFRYTLEKSWGFSAGLEHQFNNHWRFYARYRVLKLNQFVEMWEGERHVIGEADCGCWFQRHDTVDATSTEAGVRYEF